MVVWRVLCLHEPRVSTFLLKISKQISKKGKDNLFFAGPCLKKIAARFRKPPNEFLNCTHYRSLHKPGTVQEVRRIPCILLHHHHPGLWFDSSTWIHTLSPYIAALPNNGWLKTIRYVNGCLIDCVSTLESSSLQLFWMMHTHNKSWWSLNLRVQGLIIFKIPLHVWVILVGLEWVCVHPPKQLWTRFKRWDCNWSNIYLHSYYFAPPMILPQVLFSWFGASLAHCVWPLEVWSSNSM